MDEITTIAIRKSTRERLSTFGKYGDSADDIINNLLDMVSKADEKKKEK